MKQSPFSLKRILISMPLLFLIIGGIALYQYQKFQIDLVLKDMPALHKKHSRLVSETAYLQAEIDRLSNINRISSIAKKEFGLVFDEQPRQTLVFENSDRLSDIRKEFADKQKKKKPETIQSAGVN